MELMLIQIKYKTKADVDSPLSCLCKNCSVNLEAIKLLLDFEANPNTGTVTPLYNLGKNKNLNYEAIQLFNLPSNQVTPLYQISLG